MARRAAENGDPALALTDHGNVHGLIKHYQACQKYGVRSILGWEPYVTRAATVADARDNKVRDNWHLILLAADQEGYANTLKLATFAGSDGFYYRAMIDRDAIARHSTGVVCLSGCLSGELMKTIQAGGNDKAVIDWYRQVFGDRFFLEIQSHDIPDEVPVNRRLIELSRWSGIPLVATQDAHYLDHADAPLHDIEMRVQSAGKLGGFSTDQFFVKSRAQLEASGLEPSWLNQTLAVAEMCNVTLDLGKQVFPRPAGVLDGYNESAYLTQLADRGLYTKYPRQQANDLVERLVYELDMIERTGYVRYFLIVADVMMWAREQGIPSSARGSAAGSLVAYCLGITPVDPIRFGLVFERFLNEGRTPDIDLDFADSRRGEVIDYLVRTYGSDRVAQIATFSHMGGRASVKDVARVLGLGFDRANVLSQQVPDKLDVPDGSTLLTEAVRQISYLKHAEGLEKQVLDTALQLEGTVRGTGTHAAGVVLGDRPLVELTALQRPKSGDLLQTQIDMHDAEKVGLTKFDFLGLANLSIVADTVRLVRQHRGIDLTPELFPDWDARAEDLLQHGETTGIFQLESGGLRRYLKQLRPDRVEDLMAMVALYRPGPLKIIPEFIDRKVGNLPVTCPHPLLEPILAETQGLMVYQEAIMQMATDVAGFTKLESDQFLYAVRKKKKEVLAQWEPRFRAALETKMPAAVVDDIWKAILPFADYGFNKSHAACYGVLAYQTAFLKGNYTPEYMAALLTSEAGNHKKVSAAVSEARRFDVPVYGPDVNQSDRSFTVEGGWGVRFGLTGIKNVGPVALDILLSERARNGPFASLSSLRERCGSKVNVRVLESLVLAGALDSLGPRDRHLFLLDRCGPVSRADWIAAERAVLGLTLSDSPLSLVEDKLLDLTTTEAGRLADHAVGDRVAVGGLVEEVRTFKTKKGQDMASLKLADWTGDLSVTVFPRLWASYEDLAEGSVVVVRGRVDQFGGELQVNADRMEVLA